MFIDKYHKHNVYFLKCMEWHISSWTVGSKNKQRQRYREKNLIYMENILFTLLYSIGVPKLLLKPLIKQTLILYGTEKHNPKEPSLEEGGLQTIDFDSLNRTLKINWLRVFLKNQNSLWFHIPHKIFSIKV